MNLDGKRILIVGACGQLGRALVSQSLKAGAKVFATDISHEGLESLKEENSDFSDGIELREMDLNKSIDLVSTFGEDSIDVVINSSYPRTNSYGREFLDVELKDFNENVSLHLGAFFNLSQACVRYFKSQKKEFSLINIASIYGVVAPKFDIYKEESFTMPVEYSAIKSGVIHLTKYLVNYVNDSRFRANCVSPGGILNQHKESFVKSYRQHTHGEGLLSATDVASSVLFFATDSSKYVTGQNLVIDDGFSL